MAGLKIHDGSAQKKPLRAAYKHLTEVLFSKNAEMKTFAAASPTGRIKIIIDKLDDAAHGGNATWRNTFTREIPPQGGNTEVVVSTMNTAIIASPDVLVPPNELAIVTVPMPHKDKPDGINYLVDYLDSIITELGLNPGNFTAAQKKPALQFMFATMLLTRCR